MRLEKIVNATLGHYARWATLDSHLRAWYSDLHSTNKSVNYGGNFGYPSYRERAEA